MNREQRKRERVALRCPIQLFTTPEGRVLDGTTRDVSSDGVYWISSMPFAPGERLQCSVFITPPGFRAENAGLCMHCRVQVVRVEETAAGFGVGCRIENYLLLDEPRAYDSIAGKSRVEGSSIEALQPW